MNKQIKKIFGSLWHFIIKYDRHFYKMPQLLYYKMRQKFITKCDSYTKSAHLIRKCDIYYIMRPLLENESVSKNIILLYLCFMDTYQFFKFQLHDTVTLRSYGSL